MPKKTEKTTKIIEKDVDYMVDPVASYVSLVSHGANGESFFIVKSKDKTLPDGLVVQRVIVPNDLDASEAEKLLKDFNKDHKKKYDTHTAYTQVDADRCDPKSFHVIKMNDDGKLLAVAGRLKDDPNMQSIAKEKEKIVKELSSDAKWDMIDEVWVLADLIHAVAAQSNAETDWQKETISMAVENFRGFVQVVLDSADLSKMVSRKDRNDPIDVKQHNKQEDSMSDDVFKIKDAEELRGIVRDCIKKFVAEKAESERAKQAREEKAKAKQKFDAEYAELQKTVKELEDKIATIEGQAQPSGTTTEDDTPPRADTDENESVFKGLFLRDAE